jgi:integrase
MARRGTGHLYYEHDADTACKDSRQHRTCTGRWKGVTARVIDGKRKRYVVTASTKTKAAELLEAKLGDLKQGIKPAASYTVTRCVSDYLEYEPGITADTRKRNEYAVAPLMEVIGGMRLDKLAAGDVERALSIMAKDYSTSSIKHGHGVLTRAIGRAVKHRLVSWNASQQAARPNGQAAGRPSKAMTRDVLQRLLDTCASDARIGSYLIVSGMSGIRPEEARALRWDHVDLEAGVIAVWRSTRASGDTKTAASRRTLGIGTLAVEALQRRLAQQQDEPGNSDGLVFTTSRGTALDPNNVRHAMQRITTAAGLGGNWSPRELRHTFVSIMSEAGVPLEEVSRLVGHSNLQTTSTIYRRELRPTIQTGATVMDAVMSKPVPALL